MGVKVASIHFLTNEAEKFLPVLKKQFEKKRKKKNAWSPEQQAELGSISASIMKRLKDDDSINPDMQKTASALIGYLNAMSQGEEYVCNPAVVLVREHAVSMYWDDRIDGGNFDDMTVRYAKSMKVPVLGVSIFDDDNFSVVAACEKESCAGNYWFDYDDIRPIDDLEKFCSLLGWEDRFIALQEVFSMQNGDEMAQAFEQVSGLFL